MTLSVPLREYVSVAFSQGLSCATYSTKQDALIKLAAFIEESPQIQTYSSEGMHVIEEVYPFFTEKFNLSQTFRWHVLARELSRRERVQIQNLGFDSYAVDSFKL